jgi:hypothetical protein
MIHQRSVLEIYEEYYATLNASARANLRSAIVRFFVPGIGGNAPKGDKATKEEMEAGIEYLKQVTIEQLENSLSIMDGVFDKRGIKRGERYRLRSPMNQFVEKAREWGYFNSDLAPIRINP